MTRARRAIQRLPAIFQRLVSQRGVAAITAQNPFEWEMWPTIRLISDLCAILENSIAVLNGKIKWGAIAARPTSVGFLPGWASPAS